MKTFTQWIEALKPQDVKMLQQSAQQSAQALATAVDTKLKQGQTEDPDDLMALAKAKDRAAGRKTPADKNPALGLAGKK